MQSLLSVQPQVPDPFWYRFSRWWVFFIIILAITTAGILDYQDWSLIELVRHFSGRPVFSTGLLTWMAITSLFIVNYRFRWLAIGGLYFGGLILTVAAGDILFDAPAATGWIYHGITAITAIYVAIKLKRRGAII